MQIIGHRGVTNHDAVPENTIAAVERAFADGADGVEVDVRVARDDVAVCVHDADLTRVAGLPWLVDRSATPQLRLASLGDGQRVPTLANVVEATTGRGTVVLDLKRGRTRPAAFARAIASVVSRRAHADTLVVSSADLELLDAVATALPWAARALVGLPDGDLDADVTFARRAGADLHPHVQEVLATPSAAQRAADLGMRVRPWTVNRPVDAQLLRVLGVSGVITDVPALLAPRLVSR